jgi:hypothetical protein
VFSAEVCRKLIEAAEETGFKMASDSIDRHPAMDISVFNHGRVKAPKINDILQPYYPLLKAELDKRYKGQSGVKNELDWVFFRKYKAGTVRSALLGHQDANKHSINVCLNAPPDFEGGGLYFIPPESEMGEIFSLLCTQSHERNLTRSHARNRTQSHASHARTHARARARLPVFVSRNPSHPSLIRTHKHTPRFCTQQLRSTAAGKLANAVDDDEDYKNSGLYDSTQESSFDQRDEDEDENEDENHQHFGAKITTLLRPERVPPPEYGNQSNFFFPYIAAGSAMVYDNTVWHGVTPVTAGTRYTLSFFYDEPIEIKYQDDPVLLKEARAEACELGEEKYVGPRCLFL